ncbi:FxSxx-COOH system tetratricopeptide repeat protein [Frankia gtarii]|uniref:FxSxx-COOH system tetratricopeptide repeat protein n=1 Tax=Frankia gtarii TaxID=2950102 RepID=UPI0021BEFE85|nr:FxSxx-COOH system tetratricopeptide repeat protein [Frankia gtarii]
MSTGMGVPVSNGSAGEPAGSSPVDFFVSYTGADEEWATWVAGVLEAADRSVRVQAWDSPAGTNFVVWINEQMTLARRTIAICSPAYFASPWGTQEWTSALADNTLTPLRVADCQLPAVLSTISYRDLHGVDEAVARRRLLEAVGLVTPSRGPVRYPDDTDPVRAEFPGKVSNAPGHDRHFIGRAAQLDQIRRRLAAGPVVVTALHGMGGVGKTQLAVEYAHRHAADYSLLWWVDAEQTALIAEKIAALAGPLGLPSALPVPDAATAVLAALGRRGDWLLVFDNAEQPGALRGWLPPGSGHVLITSRNPDPAWNALAATVKVDLLPRADAVALLTRRLPGLDPVVADGLAGELGDLPLALAQAAGYLTRTRLPPADYLAAFQARRQRFLGEGDDLLHAGRVDTCWSLSRDRLNDEAPAAVRLLELCALLAPDPIPLVLFTARPGLLDEPLAGIAGTHPTLDDTVGAVVDYSLARRTGDSIVVHRLIQTVIAGQLTRTRRRELTDTAARVLAAAAPGDPQDSATWPAWTALGPHLLHAVDRLHGADDPHRLRHHATRFCYQLYAHGNYPAAYALATDLHRQITLRLGSDHSDTSSMVTVDPPRESAEKIARMALAELAHAAKDPVPPWRRSGVRVLGLLALVILLLAAGVAWIVWPQADGSPHDCRSRAGVSVSWVDGQCIGYSDGSYRFNSGGTSPSAMALREVQQKIHEQNLCAAELNHRSVPEAQYRLMTLVYFAGFTGETDSAWTGAQVAELEGLLTWQRELNRIKGGRGGCADTSESSVGVALRVVIANGGNAMTYATRVAHDNLVPLATSPAENVLGVIGMDRSTLETGQAIMTLGKAGVPVVGTTLSGDGMQDFSPLYFQMVPDDEREALLVTSYAAKNAKTRISVYYPQPPADTYDAGLPAVDDRYVYTMVRDIRDQVRRSADTMPGTVLTYDPRGWGPGQATSDWFSKQCATQRPNDLIFYAGRHPEFPEFITGMKSCLDPGHLLLADDSVSRFVVQAAGGNEIAGAFRYVAKGASVLLAGKECFNGSLGKSSSPFVTGSLREFCTNLHNMYVKTGMTQPTTVWPDERIGLAYDATKLFVDIARNRPNVTRANIGDELRRPFPGREQCADNANSATAWPGATGCLDFGASQVAVTKRLAIIRLDLGSTELPSTGGTPNQDPEADDRNICKYVISGLEPKTTDCFGRRLAPLPLTTGPAGAIGG